MYLLTEIQHKVKLIELKEEKDKYAITIGGYNTLLLSNDSTSRPKIGKNLEDINNTIKWFDLISIYTISHPNNRIDTICKYTWNIHKNRPYSELQNESYFF